MRFLAQMEILRARAPVRNSDPVRWCRMALPPCAMAEDRALEAAVRHVEEL